MSGVNIYHTNKKSYYLRTSVIRYCLGETKPKETKCIAIKEIANIDLDKREFYLFEGMPIAEMALEILKIKGYVDAKNITKKDIRMSENVAKRKKEVFKEINVMPKPFVGVRELITNTLSDCSKAVVSGSSKKEVDTIINEIFGTDVFNIIIIGDQFEGKGKPDPASYEVALRRLSVKPSDAVHTHLRRTAGQEDQ